MDLSIAINNLTSVAVLVFILGFIGARFKSDLRIPESIYQLISIYLLLGIGLKGGHALKEVSLQEIIKPSLATLLVGSLIPFLAFYILKTIKYLSVSQRGALAAHYGSTSLVTFSAAVLYLENNSIFFEGYSTALLTIMEVPGLVVGIYLASQKYKTNISWGKTFQEILLGKTVLLLVGGLFVGFLATDNGYQKVSPFFVDLLNGFLVLFLLQLGYLAGNQLNEVFKAGFGLVLFAIIFPIFAGLIGAIAGSLAGMSYGGTALLAVLSASASYIAAPAAVSIALPKEKLGLALTCSIGITFPFNLVFGIPIYLAMANFLVL
ncbi:MAG: sodium-dependent bicarbonate transport family permease [Actinobacteria bacterium]|nr:sodium-dependent bicarbonate transport family permease [Actinomycetota bacterium]